MCEEKLFFWKFYGIRKDICIANKRGVKMIKFPSLHIIQYLLSWQVMADVGY